MGGREGGKVEVKVEVRGQEEKRDGGGEWAGKGEERWVGGQ